MRSSRVRASKMIAMNAPRDGIKTTTCYMSPARLTRPLKRKKGSERGAGEFEPISWEEALSVLEQRLRKIRADDPKKFAFFTGRDQMQALTGLFARQFGTPNYAAHGGFCSRTCSSPTMARRCASTRLFPGNIRSRCRA